MRALLQRAARAEVRVEGEVVGAIAHGLVVLVGIGHHDSERTASAMAARVVNLRLFRDQDGRTNRSLLEVRGEVLAISQFTLLADTSRGRRPSFLGAAPAEQARALYASFASALEAAGVRVVRGIFGAEMEVELVNDGPMTIWLDSDAGS